MTEEYERMRTGMQAKIDDLLEQLRKERENAAGSAKELQAKL